MTAQYVWDLRYIDAPVLRWRDADARAANGLEETLYYCNDANMNVTALVDTDGDVVERYRYDPYGQVTFLEANWTETAGPDGQSGTPDDGTTGEYGNENLYCGYRFDSETHLYHVRYRMYHPTLGRWLQRDPMGYADGNDAYCYCGNRPTRFVDPTGMHKGMLVGGGAQAGDMTIGPMWPGFGAYMGVGVREKDEKVAGFVSHRHYEYEVWECQPGASEGAKPNLKSGEDDSWFWDAGQFAYFSIVNLPAFQVMLDTPFDLELPPEEWPERAKWYGKCTSGWLHVDWEFRTMAEVSEQWVNSFKEREGPDPAFWDEYAHKPSRSSRPDNVMGPMQGLEVDIEWECDKVTKFETKQSIELVPGPQRPGHQPYTDTYLPGDPGESGVRTWAGL